MDIWKELQDEGVDAGLLEEIRRFRAAHPLTEEAAARVPAPRYLYYGREIWESAAAALLCGQHVLLAGPKATGKNVLAENLASVFGRPVWDVSMYVNVDAAALIGADTLQKGEVVFREGPICRCARLGAEAFRTRLMLRPVLCARGSAAAEAFYTPDRFTRVGAMPAVTMRLLQDRDSVQMLDGRQRQRQKAGQAGG